MTTLVLGASENPERYSYKAIHLLRRHGHEVVAVGLKAGQVLDVPILRQFPEEASLHTITLYVSPANQAPYLDAIVAARPQRVIFNPGTENPELMRLCMAHNIEPVVACTLVMLSTGQYGPARQTV